MNCGGLCKQDNPTVGHWLDNGWIDPILAKMADFPEVPKVAYGQALRPWRLGSEQGALFDPILIQSCADNDPMNCCGTPIHGAIKMFEKIQAAGNSRTANSEVNTSLFEDSYSDKVNSSQTSQVASWRNDQARFNLDGDSKMLSVPSLQLVDFSSPTRTETRLDTQSELAQAPTDAEQRSSKMMENLTKYADDNKLTVSNLDAVGINNINQSFQRVVDNCPKNGDVKQTESGGQLTGFTTIGPHGESIPTKTGETVDRYYKNEDGFKCHARTINTIGAVGELERVMETKNHTKIYLYNQLPANGEIRIDVLLPDGKSGCQMNVQTKQLKEVLNRIKQAEKEQITARQTV